MVIVNIFLKWKPTVIVVGIMMNESKQMKITSSLTFSVKLLFTITLSELKVYKNEGYEPIVKWYK